MDALVNWWAIIISAVISVVLGFIWYGPLFGKVWMKHSGITMPEHKPGFGVMIVPIIYSLIGAILAAYMLSVIGGGWVAAFWLWLGFVVPVYLNFKGWEGKSWPFVAVNAGYWLAYLLIAGCLIAYWA
jgi:hypothetical protein